MPQTPVLERLARSLSLLAIFVLVTACTPTNSEEPPPDTGPGAEMGPLDAGPTTDAGTFDDMSGPDAGPRAVPRGCNPVAFEHDCMLPFPSDFFLVDDPKTPSGRRLAWTEEAALRATNGARIDPTTLHPADGFSQHMPILAVFPSGVDTSNLPSHTGDPDDSTDASSPTLVLDAETGEAVPHWVELDADARSADRQALFVRLYEPLAAERRYIVAFRGLRDPEGERIEAPHGFREIRDGESASIEGLEETAIRYEDEIFPALARFGVARPKIQLAWDFTTRSREQMTRDLLDIRADLMAKLDANPPAVTIETVEDRPDEALARIIEGHIQVPLYVDSDQPGTRLVRGADGSVISRGTTRVPFSMRIPRSVLERDPSEGPARLVQYGHGFFGSRKEIEYGAMTAISQELGFATISVDWWGMSEEDLGEVLESIAQRPSETLGFVDRVHQAMANQIALTYAARESLLETAAVQVDGTPVYDPGQVYYYGISQGHILGTAFVALSPGLERVALGVGGAPFSFMMSRSTSFAIFLFAVRRRVSNRLDAMKFVAMTQLPFDRIDPLTWAPHVVEEPLAGAPSDRVALLQIGIGDLLVPTLSGEILARATGTPLLEPAARDVPLLETVAAPTEGSAFVEVAFPGEPQPGPLSETPDVDNAVHDRVRRNPPSVRQLDAFLRPGGRIEHFCDGGCNPD